MFDNQYFTPCLQRPCRRPRAILRLLGSLGSGSLVGGLVFELGGGQVLSGVLDGVLLLLELGLSGDGLAVDALVLLRGLAGGVLGAFVGLLCLEAVDFLLGLRDVLGDR